MAEDAINIGGVFLGSSIKGESQVWPMIVADVGAAVGVGTGKVVVDIF